MQAVINFFVVDEMSVYINALTIITFSYKKMHFNFCCLSTNFSFKLKKLNSLNLSNYTLFNSLNSFLPQIYELPFLDGAERKLWDMQYYLCNLYEVQIYPALWTMVHLEVNWVSQNRFQLTQERCKLCYLAGTNSQH